MSALRYPRRAFLILTAATATSAIAAACGQAAPSPTAGSEPGVSPTTAAPSPLPTGTSTASLPTAAATPTTAPLPATNTPPAAPTVAPEPEPEATAAPTVVADPEPEPTGAATPVPEPEPEAEPEAEPSVAATGAEAVVRYTDAGFVPDEVRVPVGGTVLFRNDSSRQMWVVSDPHPAHTDYPGFDSGRALAAGEAFSFTFRNAGKWGFHNELQPSDGGKVEVE
ncbi:MAG: cupredoxin domain-containing protein [Anaerolineae bacterium]